MGGSIDKSAVVSALFEVLRREEFGSLKLSGDRVTVRLRFGKLKHPGDIPVAIQAVKEAIGKVPGVARCIVDMDGFGSAGDATDFYAGINSIREDLLDLSRRNALLNFRETKRSLRVVDELPDVVHRQLVDEGKALRLAALPLQHDQEADELSDEEVMDRYGIDRRPELPQPQQTLSDNHAAPRLQTPLAPSVLERRARRLRQLARTQIEESGTNLLYLAIGFLEWRESKDSSVTNLAPLVLVPVRVDRGRLSKKDSRYEYSVSHTGEDVVTNVSLQEKLKQEFDLALPDWEMTSNPEEYLRHAVRVASNRPEWTVRRQMVLSFFSFSKLLLYRDLDPANWPDGSGLLTNPTIRQLIIGAARSPADSDSVGEGDGQPTPPAELPVVLDADSSQLNALACALEARGTVIYGPPGTGKSQTITNLLALALKQGKTVLFVAEKLAALEVVRRNLERVGLDAFCLDVHSHGTKKTQLLASLKRRLSASFRSPNAIDDARRKLIRHRDRLDRYVQKMNAVVTAAGETAHEVLWGVERWSTPLGDRKLRLRLSDAAALSRTELEERTEALELLSQTLGGVSDEHEVLWSGFTPGALGQDQLSEVAELSGDLAGALSDWDNARVAAVQDSGLPTSAGWADLRDLARPEWEELPALPRLDDPTLWSRLRLPGAEKTLDEFLRSVSRLRQTRAALTQLLGLRQLPEIRRPQVANARSGIREWIDAGLGDVHPSFLPALRRNAVLVEEGLKETLGVLDTLRRDFGMNVSGPRIGDQAQHRRTLETTLGPPSGLPRAPVESHFASAAPAVLANALDERDRLVKAFAALKRETEFDLPASLTSECLEATWKALQENGGKLLRWFSKDYRAAVRFWRSVDSTAAAGSVSHAAVDLRRAAELFAEAERFSDDDRLCEVLGREFSGLDSDWDRLDKSIAWARGLRRLFGDAGGAMEFLGGLDENRGRLMSLMAAWQAGLTKINEQAGELDKAAAAWRSPAVDLPEETPERLQAATSRIIGYIDVIAAALVPGSETQVASLSDLQNALEQYQETLDQSERLASASEFAKIVGSTYQGEETPLADPQAALKWLTLARRIRVGEGLLDWIAAEDSMGRVERVKGLARVGCSALARVDAELQRLESFGEVDKGELFAGADERPIEDTVQIWRQRSRATGLLGAWGAYRRAARQSEELGLGDLTGAALKGELHPDQLVAAWWYAYYSTIAQQVVLRDPDLIHADRASCEQARTGFAEADSLLQRLHREEIAAQASKSEPPAGVSGGKVRDLTELALLSQEIGKKKRHLPVRRLMERAGKAIQALKPCFMMSPHSVAQYLTPGGLSFDLVVMDEASQIKPAEALGAIARGQQTVVVGDQNQLPPTSFFDTVAPEEDEDDAYALAAADSILDICSSTFPESRRQWLNWHYRSQHESLIAFSNRNIYDDRLIVFPSPRSADSESRLGVHRQYVEAGRYVRGARHNPVEARAVAEAVASQLVADPNSSVGVATFNGPQRDLILDQLERLRKQDSRVAKAFEHHADSTEPLFVKNLENVQGDERDIIFISTTFGPDTETQKVFQRFGPISGSTGWRRLNVLVTRAKQRVEVFTSMQSSDVLVSEKTSRGVRLLKGYLEYAETGRLGEAGTESGRPPDSDFEIAVAGLIEKLGFEAVPQVGVAGFFIDIGVRIPGDGEFFLGIECDGAAYHSSRSARDRDRLRQDILVRLGWSLHRIWSTDWFVNREGEAERLRVALETEAEIHRRRMARVAVEDAERQTSIRPVILQSQTSRRMDGADRQRADAELRDELVTFRDDEVLPEFGNPESSILRNALLDIYVQRKPSSTPAWHAAVPMDLRQATDPKQTALLEQIFEIIDGYT